MTENTAEFRKNLYREFEASCGEHDGLLLAIALTTAERVAVVARAVELQRLLAQHGVTVDLPWTARELPENSGGLTDLPGKAGSPAPVTTP